MKIKIIDFFFGKSKDLKNGFAIVKSNRFYLFFYLIKKALTALLFGDVIVEYNIDNEDSIIVSDRNISEFTLEKRLFAELRDAMEELDNKDKSIYS